MTTPSAEIQPGKPEQGPFINLDNLALPAAGAFTTQGYTKIPQQSRRLNVVVTYAKGAGATSGSVTCRVQWRVPGGNGPLEGVYEVVIDGTTVAKADPFLQNPEYAYEIAGPITTTSISFRLLSLEVPILADAVRVLAAELTDTANPGTVTVRLYTSSEV